MRFNLTVVAITLLLYGCASSPTTPYRVPQVSIAGAKTDDAKLAIIQRCVSGGGTVEESTSHQFVCSRPMDSSFGSVLYRALATPRYSTNPEAKVHYSFVEGSGQLYISVSMFLQNQTAYGRVDKTPITNGDIAAQAQKMLNEVKASLERTTPSGSGEPSPHEVGAAPIQLPTTAPISAQPPATGSGYDAALRYAAGRGCSAGGVSVVSGNVYRASCASTGRSLIIQCQGQTCKEIN